MVKFTLDIDQIRTDGGTQIRSELNEDTVAEYAEAYKSGAHFPPITVCHDGVKYWLADGFHRYFASVKAGREQIGCEIINGTKRDAVLHAVGANADHGLRRTNADKRKAVTRLLEDEEWGKWSDNQIAKQCHVSNHLVADIRKSILENSKIPTTRTVERDGTTYQQDTSNIGEWTEETGQGAE